MKRFKSIRIRFAVLTSSLLLLVLVFFSVFIYLRMEDGLLSSIDDSLRLNAAQTISLVNIENGQINLTDVLPETPSTTDLKQSGLTLRIISLEGNILQSFGQFRSLPINQKSLEGARMGNPELNTVTTTEADQVRIYTVPIFNDLHILGFVQVVQNLNTFYKTLDQLLLIFLISIPLLTIITLLSAYLIATRVLAPIDQITRTAQQISNEDLSARLNLRETDDEIGRLSGAFDSMLSRLEEGFNRERQFTADASHELRTPLTAMQAILNVIREKRRSPEEYEKALDDISEETDHLRTLAEDLLYIVRNDRPQSTIHEKINLTNLLKDLSESFQPMISERKLALQIDIQNNLYLLGDNDALIRLFANLLDNAIKFTDAGIISINAALKNNQTIEVIVSDTGEGISKEHLPHIFERFYQGDASRSSRGAGLGLAIVRGIVQAHHGRIEVASKPGVGTKFILSFPTIAKHVNKSRKKSPFGKLAD